ncbi:DUF5694 domain-containing protein [uncultured Psychroserpens sp.]|uniref:DUF5694 domain-containing protein n=1 Tax=uncultured Psychroserpens sp. TaxID=255436 RepID=UPI00261B3A01|nr:DUF5694 domain-containing protein [uncultured Psychroserpens sp.]
MKIRITIFATIILLVCCKSASNDFKNDNQFKNSKTIKVYLLGTFHFAQTDSTYNILDKKHQESIEKLSSIIANQKPDKIFVERQPEFESQNKMDSLYNLYLKMTRPSRAKNEIYQVGFRVAKKLNHKKVYQCDHPGRFGQFYRDAKAYAEKNNQTDALEGKKIGTVIRYKDLVDEDSIMKNSSLINYLQWINSDKVMDISHAYYITNFPQIGSTNYYDYHGVANTLIGSKITTDWYRRNIMIYSKIINQVDYRKDKAIFLLMGADHIPIIKNLFDANPYFTVANTSDWLKN